MILKKTVLGFLRPFPLEYVCKKLNLLKRESEEKRIYLEQDASMALFFLLLNILSSLFFER
ncbi:hypothetical protein HMPREF1869_00139 [Bacteroidales bacterium KA00251]|nr:hypothetical protein HMPREF1869_00139 [Bacteroidales bacterium KA00251]